MPFKEPCEKLCEIIWNLITEAFYKISTLLAAHKGFIFGLIIGYLIACLCVATSG